MVLDKCLPEKDYKLLIILGVVLVVLLREQKAGIAFLLSLAVGLVLMFSVLNYTEILLDGLGVLQGYFDSSGYYIKLIIKMIGITYLCEFGTQVCKDVGQGAVAMQIEMMGKIMVLVTGLPIVLAVLEQIMMFEG